MNEGQGFSDPLQCEWETACVHSWEKNHSAHPDEAVGFLQAARCLEDEILTTRMFHVCSLKHMQSLIFMSDLSPSCRICGTVSYTGSRF